MARWYIVIEIRVWFRSGLRLPLRENDTVEVWIAHAHIGSLSGQTVRHLIEHHMAGYEVQRAISADLTRLEKVIAVAKKPLHPIPPDKRAALRAARRTPKPRGRP